MRSTRREALPSNAKDGSQTSSSSSRRKPSRHTRVHDTTLALGNQALQHLRDGVLAGRGLSQPGDHRELQAHRTAERVLSMSPPTQAEPSARGSTSGGGSGQTLPDHVRHYFEPRFGTRLDHVRIRSDRQAALEAHALSARAFTYGNVISFAYGQYAPHSNEGLHLLAHELAHVTQDASTNTVHREFWKIDDSARTIERNFLVNLNFNDTLADILNGTAWTETRRNTFRTQFEHSIENTFNNSSFVIKPPQSYSDVLPQRNIDEGYRPLVDIMLMPGGGNWPFCDWDVDVSSNPTGVHRTSSSSRTHATLDEHDNTPIRKRSSAPGHTQIATVHEFGHFIGLDHPGHGLSASERSPGATAYSHSGTDEHGHAVHGPTDLMGGGMGLRDFYFQEWADALERHVAALRRQRLWRSIEEFFFSRPPMGDFPRPPANGPRYG